jgi:hypothetical protein
MILCIVTKGVSSNLMKASAKRRRSKKQIAEDKLQEEMKEHEIAKKMAMFEHQ